MKGDTVKPMKTREQIIRHAALQRALQSPLKDIPLPSRVALEEMKLRALSGTPRTSSRPSGRLSNGWVVSSDGRQLTDPRYAAEQGLLQRRDASILTGFCWS